MAYELKGRSCATGFSMQAVPQMQTPPLTDGSGQEGKSQRCSSEAGDTLQILYRATSGRYNIVVIDDHGASCGITSLQTCSIVCCGDKQHAMSHGRIWREEPCSW